MIRDFPLLEKGIYRHYKNSQLYEVLGVALQTESNEPLVVYRPLYQSEYEMYARPYGMFTECITVEGVAVPRFEKVSE